MKYPFRLHEFDHENVSLRIDIAALFDEKTWNNLVEEEQKQELNYYQNEAIQQYLDYGWTVYPYEPID